ncbi:MAG: Asp-tRNA(Asn)/Glu-tRNA(Gln) amidotransferase subunit GatC [Phycisphaerae bacterium]|nr:Asp-tRNA(Asn)/Glu-tRNA(Gln) amidotransferase subunit GatC [Phycisphaerae bacterium]
MDGGSDQLPISTARRVAHLARLALTEEQLERHRIALSAILGHVETLRELDLRETAPLEHPLEATSRMDPDTPRPGLSAETYFRLAPASDPPYLVVPKVLGETGGA